MWALLDLRGLIRHLVQNCERRAGSAGELENQLYMEQPVRRLHPVGSHLLGTPLGEVDKRSNGILDLQARLHLLADIHLPVHSRHGLNLGHLGHL